MLKSFPAIDVRILTLDYVRSSDAGYLEERISSELNDIEISILVNNVGLDVLDYYHTISQDKISSLIRVNCFSTSILSNIFIPKFLERHKKNKKIKSAIINVASLAGNSLFN
jgi:short-subunit dehydrogenase